MDTPIATRTVNGRPCVVGVEARIRPALTGTITIDVGPCAGDTVHIGIGYQDGPQGWAYYQIAETVEHPEYGTVLVAYIDTNWGALVEAPKIRAIEARRHAEDRAAHQRWQDEEDAVIRRADED